MNVYVSKKEAACSRYLVNLRWPHGIRCLRCSHPMRLRRERDVFQCSRCAKQQSVTAGTLFHKSRLSLQVWFDAMRLILLSPEGISALQLQKRLGLRSYRAAWLLAHKIRAVIVTEEKILWKEAAATTPRFIPRRRAAAGTPHGWSSKYHHAYAAEFSYRTRYRDQPREAFDRLLRACLHTPHIALRAIQA